MVCGQDAEDVLPTPSTSLHVGRPGVTVTGSSAFVICISALSSRRDLTPFRPFLMILSETSVFGVPLGRSPCCITDMDPVICHKGQIAVPHPNIFSRTLWSHLPEFLIFK
jgi:hypothetical protein